MYKVEMFISIGGHVSTITDYETFLKNNQNIEIISVNVIGNVIFLTYKEKD